MSKKIRFSYSVENIFVFYFIFYVNLTIKLLTLLDDIFSLSPCLCGSLRCFCAFCVA